VTSVATSCRRVRRAGGQPGEAAAFRVREPKSVATEVGFQHAIFLLQVGNDVLLVPFEAKPAIMAISTCRIMPCSPIESPDTSAGPVSLMQAISMG